MTKFTPQDFIHLNKVHEAQFIEDQIKLKSHAHSDLWQRTYYHFRNDNAPMLMLKIKDLFFSFSFKAEFSYQKRFDQCGVAIYLNEDNWLKASIEAENENYQHLGSVVTNHGYSDWATQEIDNNIKAIWYRLNRREDDFKIEYSLDGIKFHQMRICHLAQAQAEILCGLYIASPENSSFSATFSHLQLTSCVWEKHQGQEAEY